MLLQLLIAAAATAVAAGGLPASTVSSHRLQPQPRPGSCHYRGHGVYSLPDPRCNPGAIDPAVTQSDIHRTICVTGYTETIRPPESITEPEKRASLRAYGDRRPLHDYEYDHLVRLSSAGPAMTHGTSGPTPARSPTSRTIWPEGCAGACARAG